MTAATVSHDQAVPLVTALVSVVARDAGVRALCIKGPTFAAYDLRPGHGSRDVDVLCEPAGHDRLVRALCAAGWTAHDPGDDVHRVLPAHAVTLTHDRWTCSIDVHHYFPGFLGPAADVFEVLYARATTVEVAHARVPAPDLPSAAVVWGLNVLRAPSEQDSVREIDWVERVAQADMDRGALAAVAAATGATSTLGPLLDLAGIARPTTGLGTPRQLMLWHLLQQPGTRGGGLLTRFRERPLRAWPGTVREVVWPQTPPPDGRSQLQHNLERLRTGPALVPELVRRTRRARRQAREHGR
ncbi:nucleotidyltransferase family protein [Luteipulveratus mongoliensis]|uniref:2-nitropropane dioxygenase n=1 Tax=Luteipulveratus mongoliensis TaxID=571913 RepID=A0A0K1JHM2_9MICO|nr:nucleotidyltransferase family protein [Luteipulveratus mongoliensis]AKU16098.1 hypothetical protein VV02_09885 [Luteipulveratus mongoliensis]